LLLLGSTEVTVQQESSFLRLKDEVSSPWLLMKLSHFGMEILP
jgi:hypothetical protein